jgi:polar amino acid transport system substrate-binding protein
MAEPPKTIEPGKLTVGINGDMPMTSVKDGKLIGTDGALLAQLAANLGLEVKPVQMEWSALIEATKQGKVDIMLGSMGWTKAHTKIIIQTDPIIISAPSCCRKRHQLCDLRGYEGP